MSALQLDGAGELAPFLSAPVLAETWLYLYADKTSSPPAYGCGMINTTAEPNAIELVEALRVALGRSQAHVMVFRTPGIGESFQALPGHLAEALMVTATPDAYLEFGGGIGSHSTLYDEEINGP